MKECPVCSRPCRDSYNLRRHMEGHATSARAKSKFLCRVCGRNCRDNSGLKRHTFIHISKDLKCSGCRSVFVTLEETESHKQSCFKIITCHHCGKRTASKHTLRDHIKRFHASSAPQTHPQDKRCPLCDEKFSSYEAIEDHFTLSHEISLDRLSLNFDNEQQFYEWKEQLETSTSSFYRVYWTSKLKGLKKVIFLCHRVGKPHLMNVESRKRSVKILGSNKINAYCPARLKVNFLSSGVVEVNCITTHVGHDFFLARIPLTRQSRLEIAEKIAMNVPFDDILSAYHKDVEDGNTRREHLLTRKDLHNIKRDYLKWGWSLQSTQSSKMVNRVKEEYQDLEEVMDEPEVKCKRACGTEDSDNCDGVNVESSDVVIDGNSDYMCYVIEETKDIVFHEIRKEPSVSHIREEIRASVNEVLEAVEGVEDPETLERVCKAVRDIRKTLLR